MKLNNRTYDKLKWIALVFIPALESLILAVGKIWSLSHYVGIAATVAAVGVFLGTILGVSTWNYNRGRDRE